MRLDKIEGALESIMSTLQKLHRSSINNFSFASGNLARHSSIEPIAITGPVLPTRLYLSDGIYTVSDGKSYSASTVRFPDVANPAEPSGNSDPDDTKK